MKKMSNYTIGIDISKDLLDIFCLPGGQTKQFSNDKTGFAKLIKWATRALLVLMVSEPRSSPLF
jgi:transposase